MICLLHSIRDRAKKEKSPRSVGALGVKFFVLNDFEQKLLEKNSTADFIEKKSKKFSTADFIEKKSKKFSTADFIEKNSKKNSTADSLKKNFVTIYRIFQEVKKKCQISRKFRSLNFSHPPQNLSHNGWGNTQKTF